MYLEERLRILVRRWLIETKAEDGGLRLSEAESHMLGNWRLNTQLIQSRPKCNRFLQRKSKVKTKADAVGYIYKM